MEAICSPEAFISTVYTRCHRDTEGPNIHHQVLTRSKFFEGLEFQFSSNEKFTHISEEELSGSSHSTSTTFFDSQELHYFVEMCVQSADLVFDRPCYDPAYMGRLVVILQSKMLSKHSILP